ncbi:unnamed protein product [Echinostoma caproni]|uniref:CUB domain-containing protein n=1 Tax=Echinostoma caproni TaxID=27848 RepID=A0A183ALS3_9TREM|nr:unnamed protein product [Echinostoma caproni]
MFILGHTPINALLSFHTASAQDPNCGQTAVDLTTLSAPWKVPEKALSGAGTCDYTLTGAEGKKYKLDFTAFTVGTSDQCTDDYVQVSFDGQFTEQTYKKCGTSVPEQPPESTSNVIKVKLVSSANQAGTNTFTATVTEGEVGTSDQCTDDYVQVSFDGQFTEQTYKKCGTSVPEQPPESTSNVIKVKLVSSANQAGTNTFTATVKEVPDQPAQDPNCGQTAVDLTTLSAPWKVPEKALSGAGTCDYTLTGAEGKKYKLDFTAFTVGTSDQCTDDYVQVSFDGQFTEQTYKKCGASVPTQPPVSLSNVIKVKLVSSAVNAGTNTFTATVKEGE